MELVIVGGVPGAGKSTAMRPHIGTPGVLVLDPDSVRARLGRLRTWRWLVHLVHQSLVWGLVLLGPRAALRIGRIALVQDTSTRRRRRNLLLALAARRGWSPRLVLVGVSRHEAITGQHIRGRMLAEHQFDRHWQRWQVVLTELEDIPCPVVLLGRDDAVRVVDRLVGSAVQARLSSSERTSAAKVSTSSSVVSKEHIQRTSRLASSQS